MNGPPAPEPCANTGVIAPLYVERRTARPLARAGWCVVRSGVGPRHAAAAAQTLIAGGAPRLLVWGTAGGLDPVLTPGTLVVPERVIGPEGAAFTLDTAWRAELLRRLGPDERIRGGVLASVAHPVATREEKRALAARTGATIVDMEAAAIAEAAAAAAIPCVVLRAVVDPLELALPPVVLAAIGDRLLAPEVVLRLVLRPQDLAATLRLDRAFRAARLSLRGAARRLAAADLHRKT